MTHTQRTRIEAIIGELQSIANEMQVTSTPCGTCGLHVYDDFSLYKEKGVVAAAAKRLINMIERSKIAPTGGDRNAG